MDTRTVSYYTHTHLHLITTRPYLFGSLSADLSFQQRTLMMTDIRRNMLQYINVHSKINIIVALPDENLAYSILISTFIVLLKCSIAKCLLAAGM